MREILATLNQGETAKAWFTFIRKGLVREDLLRPIIAQSWKRCPMINYSEMVPVKKIPASKQKVLCSQNHALINTAALIMGFIFAIDNDVVLTLCDKDGYCVKSLHNYNNKITVPYTCYSEEEAGCTTVGIIMKEHAPIVVCGFEHLRTNWHALTAGGVPINNSHGSIQGILTVGYPFGKIPVLSMELMKCAGRAIEEGLESRTNILKSSYFNQLINHTEHNILITEKNGRIISANEHFIQHMGIENRTSFINDHLSKYMGTKSVSLLLSDKIINKTKNIFSFKTKDKATSFKIRNCATIHDTNEKDYMLIVVQNDSIDSLTPNSKAINIPFSTSSHNNIIGKSHQITDLKHTIKKIANISSTVLIQGESGTGKELIAHAIHSASGRCGPFIPINCGSIPRQLLESELFGYEEGAFTGATKGGKAGKFEIADCGTLFLDEIGEMPMDMQVALLRFLEDKIVVRMGSTKPIKVDVRIIAATNRNLIQSISTNNFRQDLFYRLNVINLHLPPLREIKEDLPLLAQHFLNMLCKQLDVSSVSLTNGAIRILLDYEWPGNIRELRNIMERAIAYSGASDITADIILLCLNRHSVQGLQKYSETNKTEREKIIEWLETSNWDVKQAAKLACISRKNLCLKMKNLGLSP